MTVEAQTSTTWNPRPSDLWGVDLADYRAGYSDGYYGAHFGAGHDGSRDQTAYRHGFDHGRADALKKLMR